MTTTPKKKLKKKVAGKKPKTEAQKGQELREKIAEINANLVRTDVLISKHMDRAKTLRPDQIGQVVHNTHYLMTYRNERVRLCEELADLNSQIVEEVA